MTGERDMTRAEKLHTLYLMHIFNATPAWPQKKQHAVNVIFISISKLHEFCTFSMFHMSTILSHELETEKKSWMVKKKPKLNLHGATFLWRSRVPAGRVKML